MSEIKVNGVAFLSVYVEDFEKNYDFYSNVLGLEKEYDMGKGACFFRVGENGLYLQGGNKPNDIDDKTVRATFVLDVESVTTLFDTLKETGAEIVHEKPIQMSEELFWLQFKDPQGNIIEALGKE